MYKKLLISAVVLLALVSSFNICLANNTIQDATNGVRDMVNNAENTIENTAQDISNASKDATSDMANKANEMTKGLMNDAGTKDTNDGDNNYIATRTATTTDDGTLLGMNATAWTWLILGIAAIAIIALVWYYASQFNTSHHDRD